MLLYASRDVVLSVKGFIGKPTREAFLKTILSMRQDLWTRKDDLSVDEIGVEIESRPGS